MWNLPYYSLRKSLGVSSLFSYFVFYFNCWHPTQVFVRVDERLWFQNVHQTAEKCSESGWKNASASMRYGDQGGLYYCVKQRRRKCRSFSDYDFFFKSCHLLKLYGNQWGWWLIAVFFCSKEWASLLLWTKSPWQRTSLCRLLPNCCCCNHTGFDIIHWTLSQDSSSLVFNYSDLQMQ